MPRRNNRWEVHQSIGVISQPVDHRGVPIHTCTPIPCRRPDHICLSCGRTTPVTV